MNMEDAVKAHDNGKDVYRLSSPDWVWHSQYEDLTWIHKTEDETHEFSRTDATATDWAVVEELHEDIFPDLEKKLIGNMDAKLWAEEFVKRAKTRSTFAIDEDNMICWFANAIMTGYNTKCKKCLDDIKNKPVEDKIDTLSGRVKSLCRNKVISLHYESGDEYYLERDIKEFIDGIKAKIEESDWVSHWVIELIDEKFGDRFK